MGHRYPPLRRRRKFFPELSRLEARSLSVPTMVGPAAFTVQRSPSFSITGPQWYSAAPFSSTGGGFFMRYACTLSRPVNMSSMCEWITN